VTQRSAFDRWIVLWIAVGCALRLTGLGVHSLWYDELASIDIALAADPIAVLRRDFHPPLYYFVIRWWVELGGQSDVWLRLLPALLSCAALALFAQWAGTVARSASRAAVALFAVAPFQVWHGQELRAYPLLEVGVLAALIGAEHVHRGRTLLGAALVVAGQAVAFGAHYMGAMLFPAIGAIALVLWLTGQSSLRRASALVVACAAGIAAWSPFLLANFAAQRSAPWGRPGILHWRGLVELPARQILVENQSVPQPWLTALYAVAGVLLALWWIFIVAALRRREPASLRVLAVFAGPLLGVLAAVVLLDSGFQPKYVFVASPATAVMIALGAAAIPRPRVRTLLGAFVVAGALLLSLWHKRGNLREDYRSACAEVEAIWRPGDAVVAISGTAEPFSSAPLRHYFRDREDVLGSVVSESDIAEVVSRIQIEKRRLHVIYREADYAVGPLNSVRDSLTKVEEGPNRFRIVRSLWQSLPR